MNIVFMGTPAFAAYQLEYLIRHNYPIKLVITVPDKPAGRGLKIHQSEVKLMAEKHQIPVLQPKNLKDPAFLEELKSYNLDIAVVVAFRLLPKTVWALPKLGTFNLHASLLPDYRGAAPINHAIINGEKKSGVTTFLLDEQIDTGNILFKDEVLISDTLTAGELHDELMKIGAPLIAKTIDALENGTASPQPQIEPIHIKGAPKIFPHTCFINTEDSVENTYNLIRGLTPYPGARTNWQINEDAVQLVKLWKVNKLEGHIGEAGEFISDGKNYIHIQCKDGLIEVLELQVEGKKRMTTQDFLRGVRFFPSRNRVFTYREDK